MADKADQPVRHSEREEWRRHTAELNGIIHGLRAERDFYKQEYHNRTEALRGQHKGLRRLHRKAMMWMAKYAELEAEYLEFVEDKKGFDNAKKEAAWRSKPQEKSHPRIERTPSPHAAQDA